MVAVSKTLVLDFGGVITKTLCETHAATEAVLGLPTGTLKWTGPFDPETDPLWRAMQADEITERDYWITRTREVGALIGENWTEMSQMLMAARGDAPDAVIRPEFLAFLSAARAAGCKTAILSNELDLFYDPAFRSRLAFMSEIDVTHDGTYTRVLKPDSKAYIALLRELEVAAETCVFVDDQARNIAGAQSVGMPTIHFDVMNPKGSFEAAAGLLGLTERIPL